MYITVLQVEKMSNKLIKRILIGLLSLAIGIMVAFYLDSVLRNQVQYIFQWSTSNRIKFVGKDFHFLSTNFYYLSFGVSFLVFSIANLNKKIVLIIKNSLLSVLIFTIAMIGISALDANLKIAECTACDNGIRILHWNDISYGLILGISIILSITPILVSIIKLRISDRHQP